MEQYDGFKASSEGGDAFVQSFFVAAIEYLKTRVGYVWSRVNDNRIFSGYKVRTWSRFVQQSNIEKLGTVWDKASLPPATARNQSDKRKQAFIVIEERRVRKNNVA